MYTEMYEKYSYIYDKSMDAYDILARFIHDNEPDVIISGEDIKQLVLG